MQHPNFSNLPTLRTDRLLLRPLRDGDEEGIFEYASDPRIDRYVIWKHHQTIEESRFYLLGILERYAAGDAAPWGMIDLASDKLIGTIGFVELWPPHARGEIGYALSPGFWNHGLTSEAARKVIEYGFRTMGLYRIEARCEVENLASARVMEKCGMEYEGTLRGQMQVKGAPKDMKMYAVLRSRD